MWNLPAITGAYDDWEDVPDDFMNKETQPWQRGDNGKGLIGADGELTTWATNEFGEPHHDEVSDERRFPYVAKVDIYPSGFCAINSPDEENLFGIDRDSAEAMLSAAAPGQGLKFRPGFSAHTRPDVGRHKVFVAEVEQPQAVWASLVGVAAEGLQRSAIASSPADSDVRRTIRHVEHPHSIPKTAGLMDRYAQHMDPAHLLPYREFPWDRFNNRYESADKWDELRDDIKHNGMQEPVTLEFNPDTGEAYVSEGNHRLGMAHELGQTAPVMVYRTSKTKVNGYPMHPLRHPGEYLMPNEHGHSQFGQYMRPSDIDLPTVDPS